MHSIEGSIKKVIPAVLALAAFLAVPAGDLCAKSRTRGAEVVIQRTDGTFLAGELLAVQGRTLVVSDRISARDLTIGVDDLRAVRIVRSTNVFKRAVNGSLYAGVPAAGLILLRKGNMADRLAVVAGIAGVGALIAALRGVAKGADEFAVLGGETGKKKDFALNKLRAAALFPGSLPANFDGVGRQPKLGGPLTDGDVDFTDNAVSRPPRFHLSFEPGYVRPRANDAYIRLFKSMKFGDTHPGGSFLFITYGPTAYPHATSETDISLKGFTAEYSLNRSFAIGFAYASLGKGSTKGFRLVPVEWRGEPYYSELYVSSASAGDGYFLTAAWKPFPDVFFNRYTFKLGVEIGLCSARLTFDTSDGGFTAVDARSFRKTVPAAGVVAGVDAYYGRNLSLGIWARYRYASVRGGAFDLNGSYNMLTEKADVIDIIDIPVAIAFPAHKLDLGGPSAGVSLGLHF